MKLCSTYKALEHSQGKKNGERLCFDVIAPKLKKGQVFIAGSQHAIYLPAGWIHCVLTLEGSSLIGMTITCSERLKMLLKCLQLEVEYCQSTTDLTDTLSMITETLGFLLSTVKV